jgi:DNA polymerase III delta subunit
MVHFVYGEFHYFVDNYADAILKICMKSKTVTPK